MVYFTCFMAFLTVSKQVLMRRNLLIYEGYQEIDAQLILVFLNSFKRFQSS